MLFSPSEYSHTLEIFDHNRFLFGGHLAARAT